MSIRLWVQLRSRKILAEVQEFQTAPVRGASRNWVISSKYDLKKSEL